MTDKQTEPTAPTPSNLPPPPVASAKAPRAAKPKQAPRPVKAANVPDVPPPAVDLPLPEGADEVPANASAIDAPVVRMYKNTAKTTIFTEGGRCWQGDSIAMTDEEADRFGDRVRPL